MATPVLANNKNFNEPGYASLRDPLDPTKPREVLTVENTLQKAVVSFGLLVLAAAASWIATPTLGAIPMFVGLIGGFVLALVNIFKREPSPTLILLYAGFEGLLLGGISRFYESAYPGIVLQAVLGTLAVTGVTLALFASGKVRASAKATRIFLIAMVGYLVFSLINVILMLTGAVQNPYGLRGVEIFGMPLGIVIGIIAVFLAAYSLVTDFDYIQKGVRNQIDQKYGWTASFGLMVTIVWLYLEILRIIGLARR